MFPSSNSQNPFSHSTETFFKHPYNTYDQNPNYSAHEEPSFVSSFTSPFLGDHEFPLSEILHQQKSLAIDHADVVGEDQNIMNNNSTSMGKNISTEMANDKAEIQPKPCEVKPSRRRNNLDVKAPRKRTGKKDRHSKIRTAQGVRDRRMRLSLQIARKFFDLQDMLGFDKASKTIEWLFSKSKKAIKDLNRNVQQTNYSNESESHMSEYCEVVSAMEENYSNNEGTNVNIAAKDVTLMNDPYERQSRKSPKVAYNFHHARESRDKARARARERTKEKMIIKSLEKSKQLYESSPNYLDQLGSTFSPFETLEESTSCTKKSYSHDQADSNSTEHHQFGNVDTNGNYLGTTESFTQMATCPFFSYQNYAELSHGLDFNNSFLGFLGNWDTNSIRINSSNDGIMNMVSLGGNYPASTCLAPSRFPFQLQYDEK